MKDLTPPLPEIYETSPDEDCGTEEDRVEPSPIAQAVERLKAASFRAVKERERVPQPLFWSLFNAEIQSIKNRKAIKRQLSEILGSPDSTD